MSDAMTDDEVDYILTTPKRIGEQLRWRDRKDDRDGARELRAAIIPIEHAAYDRELTLFAEHFICRQGTISWCVGIRASGMRQPVVRVDNHAHPHVNRDGTRVTGCMMHTWSEADLDRIAVAAGEIIDCRHVQAALTSFLPFANIELVGTYAMTMEFDQYGRV